MSRRFEATGSFVPQAVSYADAVGVVRAHFADRPEPIRNISVFADIIWPGHNLSRQWRGARRQQVRASHAHRGRA